MQLADTVLKPECAAHWTMYAAGTSLAYAWWLWRHGVVPGGYGSISQC